ncbi:MAG: LLM class flavin-dependent oxidoreductase [Candidatus Lindowbacteria bacterium]|nr:LLM class flavin-dependent oxidoreductase [Candidatus Lindowbacteria bacterium]
MPIKFGVLQFFSWPQRNISLPKVYERAFDRIEVMDKTGYDTVWLAEHHFTDYSVCPSVHMMAMRVVERTQNLRVGTAVSPAAFYHPLRLAEEIALLDVLSGGRVNWGAGRGFDPLEFAAFGVPIEESRERFFEAVEVVLAAWTNERLNFPGRYWNFQDVELMPKPLQQPHPPTWIAASSEPPALWAAQRGLSIMMSPHASFAENAELRELYRQQLEKNGYTMEGRDIPMARMIAVADTDAEAAEIARSGVEWVAGAYINKDKSEGASGTAAMTMERSKMMDHYMNSAVIHGCPESVIDQIEQLHEEMHLDCLMCAPLSHSSFMAFTERVLPHFQ